MHSDKNGFRSGDVALDERYMLESVTFLAERDQAEMAVGCGHVNLFALLYGAFRAQAVGDQITDGDEFQAPFVGLLAQEGQTGHGAVGL